MRFMLKNSFLSPHRQQIFRLLGNKKEGLLLTPNWRRNKPSSFTMFNSKDFPDGMNDTEQQPDEEGKSSDKTAYD